MSDFTFSAAQILRVSEEAFLSACGWTRVPGEDTWREPESTATHRMLEVSHAVNSELLHGPSRGTIKEEAVTALIIAQEAFLIACGWTLSRNKHGGVMAKSPMPPKRVYSFTRAVNRQKYFSWVAVEAAKKRETEAAHSSEEPAPTEAESAHGA